jgi:hypothetical protein
MPKEITMLLSQLLNAFHVLRLGDTTILGYQTYDGLIEITRAGDDGGDELSYEFVDQEVIPNTTSSLKGMFSVESIENEVITFLALDAADITQAAPKPERLLVHLEGGLVQCVLSEHEPCEVLIIDYDTEGADPDEISEIPQDDGTVAEAVARIDTVVVSAEFIESAFASINC